MTTVYCEPACKPYKNKNFGQGWSDRFKIVPKPPVRPYTLERVQ